MMLRVRVATTRGASAAKSTRCASKESTFVDGTRLGPRWRPIARRASQAISVPARAYNAALVDSSPTSTSWLYPSTV
jgi:hypothetical protein